MRYQPQHLRRSTRRHITYNYNKDGRKHGQDHNTDGRRPFDPAVVDIGKYRRKENNNGYELICSQLIRSLGELPKDRNLVVFVRVVDKVGMVVLVKSHTYFN